MAAPRIAVVLGAGGTVGHAFHAGVLAALHHELGWDAGRADLIVGTSAGSIVAALLRAGLPAADLAHRARREPLSPAGAAVIATAQLSLPERPPPRQPGRGQISSPARLARAVRAPWQVRAGSLAAAVLPVGKVPTAQIAAPLDALYGDSWPAQPMWIVAVELDSGRRVVFGREGAPIATAAEAVRASCAIPAYFEPPLIDGSRYVDGGVHSTTNADLVADEVPDLVVVSAPMAGARGAVARFGPGVAMRQIARLSLSREVAGLREREIPVVAFQPTAADLAVMGTDSLDPDRLAPVCAQVFETTCHRLARSDVRERLAALV
ncbi:MAG: patatin-like phospholipase family protein [Ilumatobacteraceae bacterium]